MKFCYLQLFKKVLIVFVCFTLFCCNNNHIRTLKNKNQIKISYPKVKCIDYIRRHKSYGKQKHILLELKINCVEKSLSNKKN